MSRSETSKKEKSIRRARRTRAKIFGTASRPRLSVFRSNKHIYAQLIDDERGVTLGGASDLELNKKEKIKKTETAELTGELVAKKAKDMKIEKVIFDKGGYRYHGRVKSVAEGARKGGLEF